MALIKRKFDPPFRTPFIEDKKLSEGWTWFFRDVYDRLFALGGEDAFQLVNGQAAPADIVGMKYNQRGVTLVFIDYIIQRITDNPTELSEGGLLKLVYQHSQTTPTWALIAVDENTPDDAGIVFSITSAGQVQYTSTSLTGNKLLSTIWWRPRTLAGKATLYSSVGTK